MRPLVFALVVEAIVVACGSQQPAAVSPATAPPDHGCHANEVPCVDANVSWTGYCCPQGNACSGPFPNVGCGTKIGDACCPTQGGGVEASRARTRQRWAR